MEELFTLILNCFDKTTDSISWLYCRCSAVIPSRPAALPRFMLIITFSTNSASKHNDSLIKRLVLYFKSGSANCRIIRACFGKIRYKMVSNNFGIHQQCLWPYFWPQISNSSTSRIVVLAFLGVRRVLNF